MVCPAPWRLDILYALVEHDGDWDVELCRVSREFWIAGKVNNDANLKLPYQGNSLYPWGLQDTVRAGPVGITRCTVADRGRADHTADRSMINTMLCL